MPSSRKKRKSLFTVKPHRKPVNTPETHPIRARYGAYANIPKLSVISINTPNCTRLCKHADNALTDVKETFLPKNLKRTLVTVIDTAPAERAYTAEKTLP